MGEGLKPSVITYLSNDYSLTKQHNMFAVFTATYFFVGQQ